jgi:hypothetical protein
MTNLKEENAHLLYQKEMLERRVQQLEEYVHDLERYIKRLEIGMTNEMLRPMTAGEGTTYEVLLDADKITDFDVMGDMLTIQHKHESHIHFPDKSEKEILQEFVFKLAQALNPPIKVTQAVLKAMEKVPEAKYLVCDDYDNLVDCRYDPTWRVREVDGVYLPVGAWMYLKVEEYSPSFDKERLAVGDYIQADCPLALQVLLGFTTEGVPKDANV